MLKEKYEFEVFADYRQFYIQDEEADIDAAYSVNWTKQSTEDLLLVSPKTITVGTVRDMDVPVTIEIHDGEPQDDFALWEHINECSIDIPSGKIIVAGCTEYVPDAPRISVKAGTYQARIFYGDLDSLRDDGFDGDDNYKIVLWPGEATEPKVLKRRVGK